MNRSVVCQKTQFYKTGLYCNYRLLKRQQRRAPARSVYAGYIPLIQKTVGIPKGNCTCNAVKRHCIKEESDEVKSGRGMS